MTAFGTKYFNSYQAEGKGVIAQNGAASLVVRESRPRLLQRKLTAPVEAKTPLELSSFARGDLVL